MVVGVDVVDIDRMKRALERSPRLRDKLFTPGEIAYSESRGDGAAASFAARFAAKEAVRKALGRSVAWHDVEVRAVPDGAPRLALAGSLRDSVGRTVAAGSLSLSHDAGVAIAVVSLEMA